MDQDRDGTISVDDLKEVYNSLGKKREKHFTFETKKILKYNLYVKIKIGKAPKEAELKAMVDEAQGPINFTMLLTLFGDRLNGKCFLLNLISPL